MDLFQRVKVMDPPLRVRVFEDVFAVHGKRNDTGYISGTGLPDDPNTQQDSQVSRLTAQHTAANCNYWMRKWGCASEVGAHPWKAFFAGCEFKTPFNQKVPHWYWHTNKFVRERDSLVQLKGKVLFDGQSNQAIFTIPKHYGQGWSGYLQREGVCRLSGYVGRVRSTEKGTICM